VSERRLRLASAALAVVGAAIAAYLLYVRQTGGVPVCAVGGCEAVQSSPYAEVLGIPVAGLGLVGFLGLVIAALAPGERARTTQATVALGALGFSGYLMYVQLGVLHAVCEWCMVTDSLMTAIAALALLRLRAAIRSSPHRGYGAAPMRRRRDERTIRADES
jgi:uncharacterized membrane protein